MSRTNGVNMSFVKDCIHNSLVKHVYIETKNG